MTDIATEQNTPTVIAIDGSFVYFTSSAATTGVISKVPLGGGAVTSLAAQQNMPYGVAIDATNVYWTTQGGEVWKSTLPSGPAVQLWRWDSQERAEPPSMRHASIG